MRLLLEHGAKIFETTDEEYGYPQKIVAVVLEDSFKKLVKFTTDLN